MSEWTNRQKEYKGARTYLTRFGSVESMFCVLKRINRYFIK